MAKTWRSPIEARIKGSLCNFQLELSLSIPGVTIPTIPIPQFPPPAPFADLECPLDDADEVVPRT